MTADVVSLADRPSLRVKPAAGSYCAHWRVAVDWHRRLLECKDCGAAVEPYDWLLKAATHEESVLATVRKLREEKAQLSEEIGRQKAELLSLKAQLPGAMRKARAETERNSPAFTAGGGSGAETPGAARGHLA